MSTTEQTSRRYFTLCERAMRAEPEYAAAREAFEEAVERGGYVHACKWRMAAVVMAEIRRTWMALLAREVRPDLIPTRERVQKMRRPMDRRPNTTPED